MTTPEAPAYRALSMLENEHVPLLRRRAPYWRPRPAACWRDVHTPAWNWVHPEYTPDLPVNLTFLDANAAYLAAASSATFAHGELERTGALATPGKLPGAYKVDAHPWNDPRIVSPLGSARIEGTVWIAHPTLALLVQLAEAGFWPDVQVHDSYTCPDSVRFRAWATAVNADRSHALRCVAAAEATGASVEFERAKATYEAIKTGYSMAVQLMRGPAEGGTVKSAVKRPDWYDTIHAQHAASTWRTVWKILQGPGIEPVMMGSVDEVVYATEQYEELADAGLLKIDDSGAALGHFKVKERTWAEVNA